jgi:hypothetical protein
MPAASAVAAVGAAFGGYFIAMKMHDSCAAFASAAADFYVIYKIWTISHDIFNIIRIINIILTYKYSIFFNIILMINMVFGFLINI